MCPCYGNNYVILYGKGFIFSSQIYPLQKSVTVQIYFFIYNSLLLSLFHYLYGSLHQKGDDPVH